MYSNVRLLDMKVIIGNVFVTSVECWMEIEKECLLILRLSE